MLPEVGPILGALLLVIDFVFLPADQAVLPGGYIHSALLKLACVPSSFQARIVS